MPEIARYDNHGDVVILVDGKVIGVIAGNADGTFVVMTKGVMPLIDGITGACCDDAWREVLQCLGGDVEGNEKATQRSHSPLDGLPSSLGKETIRPNRS